MLRLLLYYYNSDMWSLRPRNKSRTSSVTAVRQRRRGRGQERGKKRRRGGGGGLEKRKGELPFTEPSGVPDPALKT